MSPESATAIRIRTALATSLKRDVSQIRPEDSLRGDLDLDSLAMVELLFRVEDAFDIEIPNEHLPKLVTVGDVIVYVEQKLGPAAPVPVASPAPAAKPASKRSSTKKKASRRA